MANIIWQNTDLNLDDWRDDLIEELEMNYGEGYDPSEDELYQFMIERNADYLEDEKLNLNLVLNQPILMIGDLGLWYGRRSGFRIIESGKLSDCLYFQGDYAEIYVDEFGDLRINDHHHDGTNHYLCRVFKPSAGETARENLCDKLYSGEPVDSTDISRVTSRLGDVIGDVYGWKFRGRRPNINARRAS